MKISEFAEMNNVTSKMLRHYDEIGLLKPSIIDSVTGYRSYNAEQSHYLSWIIILRNLDFSLTQIKAMLSGPVDGKKMVQEMILKRIEITSSMNEWMQKKIGIDHLIKILEKEGFQMDKKIDLLSIGQDSVHEIKKNMPNMEMFLETAYGIAELCTEADSIAVFRLDISHFKQVNDDYGFDVGDNVIVACYGIIKHNIERQFNQTTSGQALVQAALGRAHGDEFIVFVQAGHVETERVAQAIINDMKGFDFSTIGCNRQMGCYIGGLVGQRKDVESIRLMVEQSIETLNDARKKGPNSLAIQAYEP